MEPIKKMYVKLLEFNKFHFSIVINCYSLCFSHNRLTAQTLGASEYLRTKNCLKNLSFSKLIYLPTNLSLLHQLSQLSKKILTDGCLLFPINEGPVFEILLFTSKKNALEVQN